MPVPSCKITNVIELLKLVIEVIEIFYIIHITNCYFGVTVFDYKEGNLDSKMYNNLPKFKSLTNVCDDSHT